MHTTPHDGIRGLTSAIQYFTNDTSLSPDERAATAQKLVREWVTGGREYEPDRQARMADLFCGKTLKDDTRYKLRQEELQGIDLSQKFVRAMNNVGYDVFAYDASIHPEFHVNATRWVIPNGDYLARARSANGYLLCAEKGKSLSETARSYFSSPKNRMWG